MNYSRTNRQKKKLCECYSSRSTRDTGLLPNELHMHEFFHYCCQLAWYIFFFVERVVLVEFCYQTKSDTNCVHSIPTHHTTLIDTQEWVILVYELGNAYEWCLCDDKAQVDSQTCFVI